MPDSPLRFLPRPWAPPPDMAGAGRPSARDRRRWRSRRVALRARFACQRRASGFPTLDASGGDNDSLLRLVADPRPDRRPGLVRPAPVPHGTGRRLRHALVAAGRCADRRASSLPPPPLTGSMAIGRNRRADRLAAAAVGAGAVLPAQARRAPSAAIGRCCRLLVIGGAALHFIGIFAPGKIDHHNVQLVLTLAAIPAAARRAGARFRQRRCGRRLRRADAGGRHGNAALCRRRRALRRRALARSAAAPRPRWPCGFGVGFAGRGGRRSSSPPFRHGAGWSAAMRRLLDPAVRDRGARRRRPCGVAVGRRGDRGSLRRQAAALACARRRGRRDRACSLFPQCLADSLCRPRPAPEDVLAERHRRGAAALERPRTTIRRWRRSYYVTPLIGLDRACRRIAPARRRGTVGTHRRGFLVAAVRRQRLAGARLDVLDPACRDPACRLGRRLAPARRRPPANRQRR